VSLPEPSGGRLSFLGDPPQESLSLGRIRPHGPLGTPLGNTG
jgi:hypothetical protein